MFWMVLETMRVLIVFYVPYLQITNKGQKEGRG